MMATTANQRIDVGALRNGDAVLTAEPGQASLRQQIALHSIQTDGGTQMRAALNEETVEEYRSYMAENGWGDFDPVVVYYDGAAYWLADGFHRIEAYRKVGVSVGDTLVPAIVHAGARRDAILHAAGANARHGLRRTNADKRRAVEALLRDEEWGKWSNPEIARRCSVDEKTVRNIRADLERTSEIPKSTDRKGADGRTIDTKNIGGKPQNYLAVDQIILALRPVLLNDTGVAIWECAAGRNQTMFAACQQALAPERVRQHELYMALYKLAEERGVGLSGNAVNGARPLPTWAQTDGANVASTPVPAPPQGDSADSLTTPLDGVSDDYSEEGVDLTWDLRPDLRADGWTQRVRPDGEMVANHPRHGQLLDREFDGNLVAMHRKMAALTGGETTDEPEEDQPLDERPTNAGEIAIAYNARRAEHGDAWAAAVGALGTKAQRAELLATAIKPWIWEYKDKYDRNWRDLAAHGNPSHSNSTFWDDIRREIAARKLMISDNVLKVAIKRAFEMLEASTVERNEAEPAGDESETAAPVAEEATQPAAPPVPSDLAAAGWELRGTPYGRYYLVNERTSQSTRSCASAEQAFEVARGLARPQQNGDPGAAPDAARSTWAYWEAQGWRLVRDSKANTLAGVHDATELATPLVISEAGVIHWLSSGGELNEANYRVAMKQPPSPAAERNARVKAMIETLTAARDLVAEYEKTTGIYSHSNNLRQAVRPMIEMLERNLTDRAAA
jgi:hypothetical protein